MAPILHTNSRVQAVGNIHDMMHMNPPSESMMQVTKELGKTCDPHTKFLIDYYLEIEKQRMDFLKMAGPIFEGVVLPCLSHICETIEYNEVDGFTHGSVVQEGNLPDQPRTEAGQNTTHVNDRLRFTEHLTKHSDVFSIVSDNNGKGEIWEHLEFNPSLNTYKARTEAVAHVIKCLGNLIPGIRNELYPVTSAFGVPPFFSVERAAAPYFGIKAYGVHMNGYVEIDGEKLLWVAKRSENKPTLRGMLDHLVAGGLLEFAFYIQMRFLFHGISCKKNMIKECEEEAGIPASISTNVTPVGAVSYMDIDGYRYKRDVLFCYDLKLPPDFAPKNEDGEVDSFRLLTVSQAANIVRRTEFYKPNCCLIILDFLFRHGFSLSLSLTHTHTHRRTVLSVDYPKVKLAIC